MSLRRVLMVDSDADTLHLDADLLVRMGLVFDSCPGPAVTGGCPLLRGEACEKLDAADGVIFHLASQDPSSRRLMFAYMQHATLDDVPLCLIDAPQSSGEETIQAGVVAWFPTMLIDDLDEFATMIKSRPSYQEEVSSSGGG